jgi:hypothetical protein
MAAPDVITPYADLDELLAELLGHWQRILGEKLIGAYVQGSFALGGGDQQQRLRLARRHPWSADRTADRPIAGAP